MTKKHYELVPSDTIVHKGITLTRIRSLGTTVRTEGALGGYIQCEKNLVQGSKAWVALHAKVYENASVDESAIIAGSSEVFGSASITGDVEIDGNSTISGNVILTGATIINGHMEINKNPPICIRSDGFYFTLAQNHVGKWMVSAGCRYLSLRRAWRHWSNKRHGDPLQLETLAILTHFETVAGIKISGKKLKKRWAKGQMKRAEMMQDHRYGRG